MRRIGVGLAVASFAVLAIASASTAGSAQPAALAPGGSHASAGIHPLRAGFSPDPFSVAVHATGSLHVERMRLGAGCRGYASAEPDVIVRFSGAAAFLRFFARSESDVTLIVADPSGRFHCNDDVTPGRDTNPMVDVYPPRPGQYDVWIGTPSAGSAADATLFVTALRTQRP